MSDLTENSAREILKSLYGIELAAEELPATVKTAQAYCEAVNAVSARLEFDDEAPQFAKTLKDLAPEGENT